MITFSNNAAYVYNIAVCKEHEGKGFGSEIFCKAISDYLKKHPNLTHVRLDVEEDNERAIKLYEKFGLKKDYKSLFVKNSTVMSIDKNSFLENANNYLLNKKKLTKLLKKVDCQK